ncbi:hypothetical protein AAHA92_34110 [Salvia divinorum]|uniref:Uncharacterized protein n=1 Tax=Salvia divinorum TaxID=28513 RepID=A0ABD1FGP7_SALDI
MTKNIEDASEPYVSLNWQENQRHLNRTRVHADMRSQVLYLVFKNLIHSPQLNTRVSEQCGHSSKKGL